MLTAIIPRWHHLYVNVGLTEPSFLTKEAIYGLDRTVPSSQNLKVKCKAATLGSNALKTRSNTVGISKTQNADRTAHTEHIE